MGSLLSFLHSSSSSSKKEREPNINYIVHGITYHASDCLPGCPEKWYFEGLYRKNHPEKTKPALSGFAKSNILDKALLFYYGSRESVLEWLPREVIFLMANLLVESLVSDRIEQSLALPMPWRSRYCERHAHFRLEFPHELNSALIPNHWQRFNVGSEAYEINAFFWFDDTFHSIRCHCGYALNEHLFECYRQANPLFFSG